MKLTSKERMQVLKTVMEKKENREHLGEKIWNMVLADERLQRDRLVHWIEWEEADQRWGGRWCDSSLQRW